MATAFGTTYRLRQPGRAGVVARFALLGAASILVCTGGLALAHVRDDTAWRVTLLLPPEGSDTPPVISSIYPGVVGVVVWIGSFSVMLAGITWLVWQYRAQENLWVLPGSPIPRTKPFMALVWWFVPIASLWKPFTCVRELRQASAARAGGSLGASGLLGMWWFLWLASGVAGVIAGFWPWVSIIRRLVDTDEPIVGWYEVGLSHVLLAVAVNQLLQAAAAVAGSFVVADIDRQQVTAVRAFPAGGNGLAWSTGVPIPPRPDAQ